MNTSVPGRTSFAIALACATTFFVAASQTSAATLYYVGSSSSWNVGTPTVWSTTSAAGPATTGWVQDSVAQFDNTATVTVGNSTTAITLEDLNVAAGAALTITGGSRTFLDAAGFNATFTGNITWDITGGFFRLGTTGGYNGTMRINGSFGSGRYIDVDTSTALSTQTALVMNGGNFRVNNGVVNITVGSLSGATGTIGVASNNTSNRQLTVNQSIDTTYGGTLTQDFANPTRADRAFTLNKQGVGKLALTGASDYMGTINLSGGTLEVAGAGAINSSDVSNRAITVTGGARLLYNSSVALTRPVTLTSGTIGGTGNVNSTLITIGADAIVSPGNSPGSQTYAAMAWNGSGTYVWELNQVDTSTVAQGATIKGVDPGYDFLNITGALAINATSGSKFNIDITGLNLSNSPGGVNNWDKTRNYTWTIITAGSISGGFDASKFNLLTGNFTSNNSITGSISNGFFSLSQSGNSILLNYTAAVVPEPSALGLFTAAFLMLASLRWRQRG